MKIYTKVVGNLQFLSGNYDAINGIHRKLRVCIRYYCRGYISLKWSLILGVILAFLIYVRLFTQPLTTMAQATTSLQSGTAAADVYLSF